MRRSFWLVTLLVAGNSLCAAERRITVREAVRMALERHPDAEISRIAERDAQAGVRMARGAFDLNLAAGVNGRRANNPTSSLFESATGQVSELTWRQQYAVQQTLPWMGVRWEAGFQNNRLSTNNPFFGLNPFQTPQAYVNVTLPLLRFLRTDPQRAQLRIRRRQADASLAELETSLLELALRTEAAYWQMSAAQASAAAAEEARELSQAAEASTQRLVQEGELPNADLSGAASSTRRREEAVAAAKTAALQAENALKALLARDAADEVWSDRLVLVDAQAAIDTLPVADMVAAALRRRAELRALESNQAAALEDRRAAEELRKPQADLALGYTAQGLAGRATGVAFPGFEVELPPAFVGGLGRGLSQIGNTRYPVYQAGLTLSMPVRNREAEGRIAQARLQQQRLEQMRRRMELQIALEVRNANDALRMAEERVRAAEGAATAARERLDSELRLLKEGQASNLSLNVRQSELAEARQLAVEARRVSNQSAAELRRAAGLTLSDFGVTVQ
jgi:outer membrane protein